MFVQINGTQDALEVEAAASPGAPPTIAPLQRLQQQRRQQCQDVLLERRAEVQVREQHRLRRVAQQQQLFEREVQRWQRQQQLYAAVDVGFQGPEAALKQQRPREQQQLLQEQGWQQRQQVYDQHRQHLAHLLSTQGSPGLHPTLSHSLTHLPTSPTSPAPGPATPAPAGPLPSCRRDACSATPTAPRACPSPDSNSPPGPPPFKLARTLHTQRAHQRQQQQQQQQQQHCGVPGHAPLPPLSPALEALGPPGAHASLGSASPPECKQGLRALLLGHGSPPATLLRNLTGPPGTPRVPSGPAQLHPHTQPGTPPGAKRMLFQLEQAEDPQLQPPQQPQRQQQQLRRARSHDLVRSAMCAQLQASLGARDSTAAALLWGGCGPRSPQRHPSGQAPRSQPGRSPAADAVPLLQARKGVSAVRDAREAAAVEDPAAGQGLCLQRQHQKQRQDLSLKGQLAAAPSPAAPPPSQQEPISVHSVWRAACKAATKALAQKRSPAACAMHKSVGEGEAAGAPERTPVAPQHVPSPAVHAEVTVLGQAAPAAATAAVAAAPPAVPAEAGTGATAGVCGLGCPSRRRCDSGVGSLVALAAADATAEAEAMAEVAAFESLAQASPTAANFGGAAAGAKQAAPAAPATPVAATACAARHAAQAASAATAQPPPQVEHMAQQAGQRPAQKLAVQAMQLAQQRASGAVRICGSSRPVHCSSCSIKAACPPSTHGIDPFLGWGGGGAIRSSGGGGNGAEPAAKASEQTGCCADQMAGSRWAVSGAGCVPGAGCAGRACLGLGCFLLGKQLGRGSFAVVWLARHVRSGALVALKVMRKEHILAMQQVCAYPGNWLVGWAPHLCRGGGFT